MLFLPTNAFHDVALFSAFDVETHKTMAGLVAPRLVVGSAARMVDGEVRSELLADPTGIAHREAVLDHLERELDAGRIIVLANGCYDLVVAANERPRLLAKIFRAYREGRIFDILISQTLDAIYGGHLGLDPRTGGGLRNPATGKSVNRYALATTVDLVLGRTDTKDEAEFRTSYALFERLPVCFWPPNAKLYPVSDTRNTLLTAVQQLLGWRRGGMEPDETGPARNLNNLAAQAEAVFCLQLGAAWSLRTDAALVEALSARVEKQHADAVTRFQRSGWIREHDEKCVKDVDADGEVVWRCVSACGDGKGSKVAVRKAVAEAYGATGSCKRCGGSGKLQKRSMVPCRGVKERGRYQGCTQPVCQEHDDCRAFEHLGRDCLRTNTGVSNCAVCDGRGQIEHLGNIVTCKASDDGCDGTGFDLSTAPYLPWTKGGGIGTDRDALMESGNDELAAFGEDEFEKLRTTIIPYLETGTIAPLKLKPNGLVASGRLSYEGSPFHQLPRAGGARETITARDGYVLGSTDYEAGELCSLSQFCHWALGSSRMMEIINASGSPGILHSDLAASVIGISIEDFLVRLKAKDKQCVDFRQASKPINFGTPGGMGSPTLVWTARKKSAGFTLCEEGPAVNEDGHHGYAGIRFCILIGGARRCGASGRMLVERKGKGAFSVCKACVDIVENVLRAAYFKRFPEIKEYFKWVQRLLDGDGRVPCLVWNAATEQVEVTRWRGGVDFPAACNNGFQALLADIMKLAYVTMTREGYLGVKDDGSPSPLAGCRFPVVMHDEPVSELIRATAHLSGPRIGEIMVEAGRSLAPDVAWVAQTALATYLSKSMEPVLDENGNLTIWQPKKKAA